MSKSIIFVDRRKSEDRREIQDPCKDMKVDLYHRKRRKSSDRRTHGRSLSDDYYAFIEKQLEKLGHGSTPVKSDTDDE